MTLETKMEIGLVTLVVAFYVAVFAAEVVDRQRFGPLPPQPPPKVRGVWP